MQGRQRKRTRLFAVGAIFLLMLTMILPFNLNAAASGKDKVFVKIKYVREDNNYNDWNVWTWSDTTDGKSVAFEKEDSEGRYIILETTKDANLGFIIRQGEGWDNKLTDDVKPDFSNGNVEYLVTVAEDGTFSLTTREPKQEFDQVNLNIHYFRFDQNYDPWDVWVWVEDNNTMDNQAIFDGTDDFGVVSKKVLDPVAADKKIGFIVRKPDWSEKDWDGDRFIDKFFIDADGNVDLYIISGQEEVYYDEESASNTVENLKNPRITSAKIDSLTDISFTTNNKLDGITVDDVKIVNEETKENLSIESITIADDGLSGIIKVKENIDLNIVYTVSITNFQAANLTMGKIFESEAFEQIYTYTGDLGAVYNKEQTTFTLWTPTASKVELALYGTDGADYTGAAKETIEMKRGDNGTWVATVTGDLSGTFYNYLVTNDGKTNEVVDPYAKALGVNGMRGMVVDLDATDPEGWEEDEKPELEDPTDSIIYEMHIRDFSISENSGVTLEYRGKYNGVWEANTTIPGTDVKTGVEHLKELGVTTVHLLPTFDHQSIDETKLDTPQFNWGYDPKNYNTPEGSYSSDPYTGTIRIEEFKQMVMELHKAGIRVVMDVVYNHTGATTDSNLNLAVPNYYYRQNAQGGFANGSGCGNETASERSMVGKLIVDSVAYWAEEYHIDGFRFDLMAIHDIDTMKEVRAAVDAIDPTILLYGEGWTGGDSPLPNDQKSTKANTVKYGDLQIAAFSDDIRDGVKGSVFDAANGGFINGGSDCEETIKFGIVASTPNSQIDYSKVKNQMQPWANQPYQTISYVSAHDNLTLWDKLQSTNPNDSKEQLIARNKMAAAIVYTSQGIPFMQAGEEMARTKVNPDGSLNENSYNAPDSVNQIDWSRKVEYSDLYEYYKGLIQLRKAHKSFHMNTTEEIQDNLTFLNTNQKNVVAYTLNGTAVGDDWETIAVIFNANESDVTVTLPDSNWKVVVNEEKAGVETLAEVSGNEVKVPAQASYVLVKAEESTNTVNKNALQTMIEKVEGLNEKDYSTASWNVLQNRLNVARDVYADKTATQTVVDQAYLDLVDAWKNLEVGLNTSAAEAVVKEAEAVLASPDLSEYRPSSVQAVRDSLAAVQAALANPETTQEQLNNTVTQLIDSLIQLKDIVNADALQRVINVAEELLQEKDRYTMDTVKVLEEALANAKEVVANEDRTEQQVTDAYEVLTDAIAGLVVRGDKSVLEPLLEKAEEILANTDAYTSSSLEGLAEVFASAKEVYEDIDAIQIEINAAAADLAVQLSQVRILGDVNNDQKVDTADAAEVLKASAELIELSQVDQDAADVKQDGIIDTADAALIEQYAAELITEF